MVGIGVIILFKTIFLIKGRRGGIGVAISSSFVGVLKHIVGLR